MVIHLLHSPKGWYRANEQLDLTMVGAKFNKRNLSKEWTMYNHVPQKIYL